MSYEILFDKNIYFEMNIFTYYITIYFYKNSKVFYICYNFVYKSSLYFKLGIEYYEYCWQLWQITCDVHNL